MDPPTCLVSPPLLLRRSHRPLPDHGPRARPCLRPCPCRDQHSTCRDSVTARTGLALLQNASRLLEAWAHSLAHPVAGLVAAVAPGWPWHVGAPVLQVAVAVAGARAAGAAELVLVADWTASRKACLTACWLPQVLPRCADARLAPGL